MPCMPRANIYSRSQVEFGGSIMGQGTEDCPGAVLSHAWGADHLPHLLVQLVDERLKLRGVHSFLDQNELLFGDIWKTALQRAIEQKEYFTVVFLSPEFANSPHTTWELNKAVENAASTGKALIPVLLADFKGKEQLLDPNALLANWSILYSEFISHKGKRLPKSWYQDLDDKCEALAIHIKEQWRRYKYHLHIFRISDPTSPALDESFNLLRTYPQDYRDSTKRIRDYITESTISHTNEHFPVELYLAACYRGEHVGAIYATCYRGGTGIRPLCYVNIMIVRRSKSVVDISESGQEPTKEIIAEALLRELDLVATSLCRGQEVSFALDLPDYDDAEDDEDRRAIEHCWHAWLDITGTFDTFRLVEPQPVPHYSFDVPDMEWEGDLEKELSSTKARLLLLRRDRGNMTRESFLRLLRYIYWTMYAETYHNPYCIRHWWKHIDGLWSQAEKLVKSAKLSANMIPLKQISHAELK